MGRLDGKVAIVTGGVRGLGGAAVAALAAEGAAVLVGDVLDEIGEASVEALVRGGARAAYVPLDVRDAASWDSAVETALRLWGRVDCLVNNAGINIPVDIEAGTADQFRAILEVNLIGAFLGIKAVLPAMRQSGGGSIINVASNSTDMIQPATSLYGASKAAIANLAKTTAVHCALRGDNIRVNSIHPGPHETEMLTNPEVQAMPMFKALLDAVPMGRMGRPEEFGKLVVFLASEDSSYITASEMFIDGGLTAVSFADPTASRRG
ncbi:MAG: short-chain dehydrogenase/reductase [Sphingomonadales bacterium]|nr:short-chain dehydrogenase/reductase [Sphingomonadales bacterium]